MGYVKITNAQGKETFFGDDGPEIEAEERRKDRKEDAMWQDGTLEGSLNSLKPKEQ